MCNTCFVQNVVIKFDFLSSKNHILWVTIHEGKLRKVNQHKYLKSKEELYWISIGKEIAKPNLHSQTIEIHYWILWRKKGLERKGEVDNIKRKIMLNLMNCVFKIHEIAKNSLRRGNWNLMWFRKRKFFDIWILWKCNTFFLWFNAALKVKIKIKRVAQEHAIIDKIMLYLIYI